MTPRDLFAEPAPDEGERLERALVDKKLLLEISNELTAYIVRNSTAGPAVAHRIVAPSLSERSSPAKRRVGGTGLVTLARKVLPSPIKSILRPIRRALLPPKAQKKQPRKIEQGPRPSFVELPRKIEQGPRPSFVELPLFDIAVVSTQYPDGSLRRGREFVRTRVEAYAAAGKRVLVLQTDARSSDHDPSSEGNITVLRLSQRSFLTGLKHFAERTKVFFVHCPDQFLVDELLRYVAPERIKLFFHGFEVRDYRRLHFNFSTHEMELRRHARDVQHERRVANASAWFANDSMTKVFVSNYLRTIAERDVGRPANNCQIIPNFINGDFYREVEPRTDVANRILLIRSFSNANYANDIAVKAILTLASRPGFDQLRFTIRGFGEHFKSMTQPLLAFGNIDVLEQHLVPSEMLELYNRHSVFLAPSRFDTQGVTLGEAMACGLACVSTAITGIPEFADDDCAILVPPEDPHSFADAILRLCSDESLRNKISRRGAARVRAQCGYELTIAKELELAR